KALYLMGGDIRREMALLGVPLETLQMLECLVVQDVFGGPVAEMAHVILPACSSAEREASYTNAYRVVQHSSQAIKPIGQCRPDLEILSALGQRLGLSALDSVGTARGQIASSVPLYDFVAEAPQLVGVGAWDYSKVASAARHRLSVVEESQSAVDEAYPFVLTFDNMPHCGGRTSVHSASLAKIRVDGAVEVGEDDAETLGAENGTVVELKIREGGSARLPVRISRELPPGVISVPAHDFGVIQKLIAKLDASTLRTEEGTPVWFASINVIKD
ncbi:MAG: molybdopterin-dependent oxidoreductase, partial [Candidatus Hydrogenedentota bacterium]